MGKINPFFLISPLLFQTTIWPATRFFLWFFVHLEVLGLEHLNDLPYGKGVIFASNHSSEIDPFLTPASLPFLSRFMPLFYTSREKGFYNESGVRQIFYGGFIFKFIGGQPVYVRLKNYEKSLINHIQLLENGYNLFVFPEGKITKDGKLDKARRGIAFIAQKTNCPIIPIGISGAYNISLTDFFLRRRTIKVTFGKPIFQNELKSVIIHDNKNEMIVYEREAAYIMRKIENLMFL